MTAATKTSSAFMTILKLGMAAGLYVLHINRLILASCHSCCL